MTTSKSGKDSLRAVLIDHVDSIGSASLMSILTMIVLAVSGGLFASIAYVAYRVTEAMAATC